MRVTVSDVISPSYFPLTAAVELGFFKAEGLDAEFIFPPVDSGRVLVDGDVDFYGASPYVAFECLPEWRGGKILCALSQYTYWFLAVRADLGAVKGDLSALKGLRISASRQPGILLRKLLVDGGLDFERDKVQVVPAPRPPEGLDNLARIGIQALTEGSADGFWGNAMRAELAIRKGIATMLLDVRRGDGPAVARGYTFPALVAPERLVAERPDDAAAAVRAVVKTQQALRRPIASRRGSASDLPARGDGAHRGAGRSRRTVLRSHRLPRCHRGSLSIRAVHRPADGPTPL